MINKSEHLPEREPKPTTPTEASDSFLNRSLDAVGLFGGTFLGIKALGWVGIEAAKGNYDTALAAGALTTSYLVYNMLIGPYIKEAQKNKN